MFIYVSLHSMPTEIFPMFVFLSHGWFSLDNLSSPKANHFKLIHKVSIHKRNVKFSLVYFSWKSGHSWPMDTRFHIFFKKRYLMQWWQYLGHLTKLMIKNISVTMSEYHRFKKVELIKKKNIFELVLVKLWVDFTCCWRSSSPV